MKKSILAIAIISTLLVACNKTENKAEVQAASAPVQAESTQTAESASNWSGEYKGILPCANCEGIQTELKLNEDKTYELKQAYLGKGDDKPFENKGSFTFDSKNTSLIMLDEKAENRKFIIGENTVTALDTEGNKIEGSLAEHYILKK